MKQKRSSENSNFHSKFEIAKSNSKTIILAQKLDLFQLLCASLFAYGKGFSVYEWRIKRLIFHQ